jgi:muconolactone delta-isomerase
VNAPPLSLLRSRRLGLWSDFAFQEAPVMQYLVTMTTHVPDGTPEQTVDEVKAREDAHSADLAAQGNLLRLWRPPLRPGEWRSLGLFVAADANQLETVLAGMPLRIWRSDEVTPLAPHPNDPAMRARTGVNDRSLSTGTGDPEFLTFFSIVIPDGTTAQAVADADAREAEQAAEWATKGKLRRLWALPGEGRALGLWQADNPAEMQAIVKGLPLDPWMTTETIALTPHPSDPASQS